MTTLRPAALLAALALSLTGAVAQQPAAPARPAPAQRPAPAPAPAPATAPSAAPAQAAPTAKPTITPSHLAVAREVAVASGIARSLDVIAPQLFEKVREQAVTRPEIQKDLNEVMQALQPEMDTQRDRMVGVVALIYAQNMTEAELKDTMAFFKSPSGRKYVETQPAVLDDLVRAMETWSHDLAEYVMVRIRIEMNKRGHQLQ